MESSPDGRREQRFSGCLRAGAGHPLFQAKGDFQVGELSELNQINRSWVKTRAISLEKWLDIILISHLKVNILLNIGPIPRNMACSTKTMMVVTRCE